MKQYKINYYTAICFDQENIFIKRELKTEKPKKIKIQRNLN
jgi:hypothetical protein